MKVKIKEKKEIAKGTLMVIFDTLGQKVEFKAGQYFFVNLINPPYNDTRGTQRHFSIVNSPSEEGILTLATRLRDSAFKKTLQELPIGEEVEVSGIFGNFVLPDDKSKPLVFIAGGIGITPFMSMLRFVKDHADLGYKVTLVYSNRDTSSTAFLSELQKLEKQIPNLKLILTMTEDPNWHGEKRRIDAQFIKEYFPNINSCSYYVVGPPPMVEAVQKSLKEAGVEDMNVKIENFSGY